MEMEMDLGREMNGRMKRKVVLIRQNSRSLLSNVQRTTKYSIISLNVL
jgi:hypothetical protein